MQGLFYGGASRSLLYHIKSISSENIDIYIYLNSYRAPDLLEEIKKYAKSVKIVPLKALYVNQVHSDNYYKYITRKNIVPQELINNLRNNEIDILHINTSIYWHYLQAIKNQIKIKIITHVRELIPVDSNNYLAKQMRNNIDLYSDKIICISENEAKQINSSKTEIIYNPIDLSPLVKLKPTLRKAYSIPENTVIIGMSSNFLIQKGHIVFLESLKIVQDSNANSDFMFVIIGFKSSATPFYKTILKKIIGKVDLQKKIKAFIRKNNLHEKIILVPFTKDILEYVADFDIVVRPALSGDPWGRDIIEAMALKKPVIATGDSDTFIKNNKTGFLVKPNNPFQLAEKIEYMLKCTRKERHEFGQNGFKLIKQKCDLESYSKKIHRLYESLSD